MINWVLPISTLTKRLPGEFINSFSTVELKGVGEVGENFPLDRIYHSSYSLVEDNFEEQVEKHQIFLLIEKHKIRRFSLDIGPCFSKVKIVDGRYHGDSNPLSVEEVLDLSAKRMEFFKKRIPSFCEVAIENLNYYPTGAYEGVCSAQFYNQACRTLGATLVLDLAHALVTDYSLKDKVGHFLDSIDYSLVREVHLSKMSIGPEGAWDAHGLPGEVEFGYLKKIISQTPSPVDVVVEYYKEPEGLIQCYADLRQYVGAQQ